MMGEVFLPPRREVVVDDDFAAVGHEAIHHVAADEAGPAGHEHPSMPEHWSGISHA